ncbi:hypothetical protein Pmani_011668 [Petrolisthes manimaculis]|uniref:Uncharacterized protein n=1 Tax=Petrolisthes manimaculis TaxID=1843537 RepID=A0AAE1UFY3_9EUCA|nr:hypothetical protein Pmani_011668 [Petrolisthes manimaculis]
MYSSQQDYGGLVSMPLSLHFRLVVADVMLYFGVAVPGCWEELPKSHIGFSISLCENWVGGRLPRDRLSLCDPPKKQSIKLGCKRPPQRQAVRLVDVILEVILITWYHLNNNSAQVERSDQLVGSLGWERRGRAARCEVVASLWLL